MNVINGSRILLFIIPFALITAFGQLYVTFQPIRKARSWMEKLFCFITEKDLAELLGRVQIRTKDTILFQQKRLLFSLLPALLYGAWKHDGSGLLWAVVLLIGIYKGFYLYLLWADRIRIRKLNQELPYGIKSIVYLSYIYPVDNALHKAIDYVPEVFRYDLNQLIRDIDEDPNSYEPYHRFVKRYDGKLLQLDFYLRMLYRMSVSASKEEERLLSNMNRSISDEINRVRVAKNKSVNETIQYLGMIPVILVTAMLAYLLVVVSGIL